MRQRDPDQEKFRQVLANVDGGTFSTDDWKYLQQRDWNNLSEEEQNRFNTEGTMICATNKDLKKFNIMNLKKLDTPKVVIKAKSHPWQARKASSNAAGGLQQVTLLADGCRAMLTKNLWKEAGLVNGAQGKIHKIIFKPGNSPLQDMPDLILMEIPQYIGHPIFPDHPKVVPIPPSVANWMEGKVTCTRTQYPIVPAYAITIHKGQGMTIPCGILNLGTREFAVGKLFIYK